MLVKLKFRFPELLLGTLLTIAIFAMGMIFDSSRHQPANNKSNSHSEQIEATNKPEPFTWSWITADGGDFFTGVLAVIACFQAALFLWQLRYMQEGMLDAKKAAEAARDSSKLSREVFTKLERPYVLVFDVMMPPKKLAPPNDNAPNFMVYDIGNFGKTPAIFEAISIGLESRPDGRPPDLLFVDSNHKLVVSDSLRPDKQHDKIPHHFLDGVSIIDTGFKFVPIVPTNEDLSFRIVINYRGPFSEGHETSGWWRYDANSESFVRCGGIEYNYTR